VSQREEVKLYFDYKSPYAYLAKDPAFELPRRYHVEVRWLPFLLRIKGKGERSVYSEHKVRYSYMDARRWANRRGGLRIMGPRKIYDSTPALIGALYAQRRDFFRAYTDEVFARFFERALEIDRSEEIAAVIERLGGSAEEYLDFAAGEGAALLDTCLAEAESDHIFGVPIFVFRGELFWGQDRIPLLEERLADAGLLAGEGEPG
jgi:2-hydroxychromene-2-carboxylate isomerase